MENRKINNTHQLKFIHIGKCGGSSITKDLMDNDIVFKRTHGRAVKYDHRKKYFILLRNPVDRFASAFYWRKHTVLNWKSQKDRFDGEYNFFQKYETIEDVIQADFSLFQKQYIHHIKEDIDFYIGDFVNQCDPNNIIGIACTETLNTDIKNIFNIESTNHKKNNKKRKIKIKKDTRVILKKYLYKDYLVVEKLNNLKLLTKEQYKILSK